MKIYYVYILLCSDRTYYTGVTSNLERRIFEHQSRKYPNSYTSKRQPVQLKFNCEFTNVEIAIDCEKQLKKWSKTKKEALINGKFELLPDLSKKKFDWLLNTNFTSQNSLEVTVPNDVSSSDFESCISKKLYREHIQSKHIAEAIQYRSLDREGWLGR